MYAPRAYFRNGARRPRYKACYYCCYISALKCTRHFRLKVQSDSISVGVSSHRKAPDKAILVLNMFILGLGKLRRSS